jgi:hypothetical protein
MNPLQALRGSTPTRRTNGRLRREAHPAEQCKPAVRNERADGD